MKFVLKPVDTFFFRNHKSLIPGTDSFASGLFPPRPGTVYGALRSAYIHKISDFATFEARSDYELVHWMGSPMSYGEFSLRATFWQDHHDVVVPLPLDHQVFLQSSGVGVARRLLLKYEPEAEHWGSDKSPYRLYGRTEAKSASATGRYLYKGDLEESLLTPIDLDAYSVSKWLIREPKIGIAHDWQTKQAKDGMLYSLDMFRFNCREVAVVAFSDASPDFSQVSLASLGAKQRPWSLEYETEKLNFGISRQELVAAIEETGVARIILLTPALWAYGVRPGCWNEKTNALHIQGHQYPILAAAIGRPLVVGGWDLVNNRPKPRNNAIPAGSVLYVTVPIGTAENLVDALHETNFSDYLVQEGYGFTVVGCGSAEN